MTEIERLSEQLQSVGIIALIPSEMSLSRLALVADALLAAPILAVEVIPNGDLFLQTLRALRKLAGEQMLVGAGRVENAEQMRDVIDAGAQFASSSAEFFLPLMGYAKKRDFLYIPTVHAPGQTLIASRGGMHWQKIRDDIDVDGLEGLMERNPNARFAINQISMDDVGFAFEAGAKITFVNDIYEDNAQSQASIIENARVARGNCPLMQKTGSE